MNIVHNYFLLTYLKSLEMKQYLILPLIFALAACSDNPPPQPVVVQ